MSNCSLRQLFIYNPQQPNAPLFRLSSGAFSGYSVVPILKTKIALLALAQADYSGHSYRKGAAQHAADHAMLDEMIQRLDRWTSNAFRLSFTTSSESLYNLNLSFQKGVPLAVPIATPSAKKTGQQGQAETPNTYRSPYPSLQTTSSTQQPNNTPLDTSVWAGRSARPGYSVL